MRRLWVCLFLPVVFVGERVKVLLFLVYHVLQALVHGRAAMSDFLQNSLKDDHIANHRVLEHIDLKHKETDGYDACQGKDLFIDDIFSFE